MSDTRIRRVGVTDQVVDQVREALESGALPPGTLLGVAELARQFDVSAGAIQKVLGILESESLVDVRAARTYVTTPTADWYLAMLARGSGLSVAAALLGVPRMTPVERDDFSREADAAARRWGDAEASQPEATAATWRLLDHLAALSGNAHLAREHRRMRTALAFGTRHLGVDRNPAMLISALHELDELVQEGDGDEAAELVRDLYAFVALPYQLPPA
jgi:DNA-binding GntR family transcriptional regulator